MIRWLLYLPLSLVATEEDWKAYEQAANWCNEHRAKMKEFEDRYEVVPVETEDQNV